MERFSYLGISPEWWALLTAFIFWDGFWKAFALWRAARNNNIFMYVVMLILNTAGILPILYLIFSRRPPQNQE